jgi:hypothetical protein
MTVQGSRSGLVQNPQLALFLKIYDRSFQGYKEHAETAKLTDEVISEHAGKFCPVVH